MAAPDPAGFGDGYDFSHDLLRETAYAGSARRNAGCCTAASPRAWNCFTPRTQTRRRPAGRAVCAGRAARAGGGLLPPGRRCRRRDVRPCRGHPAAREALSIIATLAGGTGPGPPRTRGPGGDGRAAQRQAWLLLARICSGCWSARSSSRSHSAARTRPWPAWPRCGPRSSSRGARPTATGRPPGPWTSPTPAPNCAARLISPSAVRPSAWGGPPRGSSPGPGREAGRRCRLAQHRHPPRRPREGLCRARPLAARPGRRRRAGLPRGRPAGPRHRPSLQPGGGAGLRRHDPPDASRPARAAGTPSMSCASYASGMTSPTTASGR